MMHLSLDEQADIVRQAASAISQIQEGEDAISVLSGIYCQNLTGTPRQGRLMAQALLNWMNRFYDVYEDALDAPEECLHRNLLDTLAQLPVEEQCQLLRRELRALGVSELWEGQASESVREKLLKTLYEQLEGEDGDLLRNIPPISKEEYLSRNTAQAVVGEQMLQAVTAMVIYTMAKNGELSQVPENITLAQVTVGVCTEDTLQQIRWTVKGEAQVQKRMRALRITCFVMMLIAVAVLSGGAALLMKSGLCAECVLALCGYVLLWLGVVLTVYYRSQARMIRDEAEEIPYIPVHTYSEEEIAEETEEAKEVLEKHLPWPDTAKEQEIQEEETQPLFLSGN